MHWLEESRYYEADWEFMSIMHGNYQHDCSFNGDLPSYYTLSVDQTIHNRILSKVCSNVFKYGIRDTSKNHDHI